MAIVQQTAETADIEKIKLEANERKVKNWERRIESACKYNRSIYDPEEDLHHSNEDWA